MGSDIATPVKPVETPALKPLTIKSRLAATPRRTPQFSVEVKDRHGHAVTLGDPAATRALVALMNLHAVNGGAACHWGGPAALAEIMAAVHGIMFATKGREWHEAFNFVNDAGHTENGVYALRANYGFDGLTLNDLKKFRSIDSKLTGHGESHLNPEGVLLSNGPLGSAFPQSEGLAMADHAAGLDRVTICTISDGASMEGEAKEAFASLPGFAAKGLLNPYVLILSDNNTKLSGRITHDAFDMQPTFETLEALGWKVIRVQNGHNLQAVYQAVEQGIEDAKNNPKKPVCLWVKTVKGYGVQATAESSSGGHGFPLANGEKIVEFVNEIYSGKSVPKEFANWADELYQDWKIKSEAKKAQPAAAPSVKKDKVQAGFSKAAIKAAQEGLPVVSISADLQGSTGMAGFHKNCPNRSVDVGVAESNMISIAAGYSKAGFIPIVDTFAQFGVTKGNLPLTMAALSQAPVIAAFSHIGFQDAADGASHQATTYLAAVCSIPHTVIVMPSCADEAEALMYQAIKRFAEARLHGEDGESVIFFVGRENFPVYYVKEAVYEWGKAQLLTEGDDVVIVAAGTLLDKALEAEKQLREKGTKATVIHHPFVNQPDVDNLSKALDRCKGRLVTVEDHQVVGGMGALLVHALSSHVKSWKSLGINNSFGQSAYLANHLYKMHGLDAAGIVKAVGELI